MDSESSYNHTDAVKAISNILREPAPPSGGQSRETTAENRSGATPAKLTRVESSEMEGEPSTHPARDAAKLPRPSSGTNHVRASLWGLLVGCVKPIFSRLREYFLEPVIRRADGIEPWIRLHHEKFDSHVTETRADTECIKHQLVHMEFQSQSFAKQLAHLESQFGMFTNQLARLESAAGRLHGGIEFLVDRNSLVVGDELLARTPDGYVLVPADGPGFARFLAEAAVLEQATSRLLDLTLRDGMTFVDVGANVGLHTLHGARRVGPTGAVIALESLPKLFRLLRKSVRLNDVEDICKCLNIRLFSADGVVTLQESKLCGHNSLNQSLTEEGKAELQVRTGCLDDVLQDARRVDVVKIDAGGAELDVLEGMNQVLASHRDIVLIVHYRVGQRQCMGITPVEWFDRFFAHGFALFASNEQTRGWLLIEKECAVKLPSTMVAFVKPGTSQWTILQQHEL